jgi:CRP/FNR family transcriptional regulator, anaerobic regulatory protein
MKSSCQVSPASQPAALARSLPSWRPARSAPVAAPTQCSTCRVRKLCLAGAVQSDDSMSVDELVLTRKRVHTGEHLFRAGDPFNSLYAFRSGFFKSYAVTQSGRTQVTAFPMAGDLAGLDGIGSETHGQNLVALETGEVCVVQYAHLQKLIGLFPRLQHQVNRIMSREIVREQNLMTLLGTMDGEARVAEFLLSLASRFAARGYSSTEFNLRMSRAEIGSYLGLTLETVSRIVSKLQRLGLIWIKDREVGIVDLKGLHAIATDEKEEVQTEARHTGQLAPGRQARHEAGNVASFRLQR